MVMHGITRIQVEKSLNETNEYSDNVFVKVEGFLPRFWCCFVGLKIAETLSSFIGSKVVSILSQECILV